MTLRRLLRTLCVIPGAAVAACSGGAPTAAGSGARVDTLPSGTVVVRGTWRDATETDWRPVEVFRIGAPDAEDPYVFSNAWTLSLALDAHERLYVSDMLLGEVRLFDDAGRFVRTVAPNGEGPGEVAGPMSLTVRPQTQELWIVDRRSARYTVIDSAGALRATYPRTIRQSGIPWRGWFGSGGNWYEPGSVGAPRPSTSLEALIAFEIGDGEPARPDTFRVGPGPSDRSVYRVDYGDGSGLVRGIPFAPEFVWDFDGGRGTWGGSGETYRIFQRSLEGDTLRIVDMPGRAVPVTAAERDEHLAWVDDLPARVRDQVDPGRVPETRAEFDRILVDDRGFVWVSAGWRPIGGSGEPATYDVFDPEGLHVGTFEFPFHPRPYPVIAGDRIVGVSVGPLDVPQIVAYRLEGRP